jgi:two-component system, NarL family, sensor histidine kinase UhpB
MPEDSNALESEAGVANNPCHAKEGYPVERSPTKSQTRQCVISQEAEYRRLARHLHDGIGQLLAATAMHAHLAKDLPPPDARPHLEQCLAIVEQAIEQVRDISLGLSPSMLGQLGLPDTLRLYLNHQAQRTGLAVNLIVSSAWTPLPPEVEAVCFRVTQEAVVNAIRHASAGHVQVELRQDPEAVYLTIRDNGAGFDPAGLEQPEQGRNCRLGLPAMRMRVELLGGCWNIESAPGQGTVIRAFLPSDGQPSQANGETWESL